MLKQIGFTERTRQPGEVIWSMKEVYAVLFYFKVHFGPFDAEKENIRERDKFSIKIYFNQVFIILIVLKPVFILQSN